MANLGSLGEPKGVRSRRPRRAMMLGATLLGLLGYICWFYGPGYVAYWRYVPVEGDVIFQSLPHSPLVDAIEGVTQSPYSHCGIVRRQQGRWVVYEALGGVEINPLSKFLFRGREFGFAVYRLKDEFKGHIPKTIECLEKYLGRPYDGRYHLGDEEIYCSELIYKAYRDATDGEQLGRLVRFGDMNWAPFEETVRHFENGPIPVDRQMITPKDLANADQLQLVFSFAIPSASHAPDHTP